MGMSWAEHSVEIDAPIETCFDAIVDYESFAGWQDAVDSVDVLTRTKDGIGEEVRLHVDAKIRKIDYVLRYRYDRPTEIRWDFVEGNGMRDVDGVYTFEELGPDRTRATYKLGADPEIPVPGMVLKRTHRALVKRSVEDLRKEAERRAATDPGAQPAESPEEAVAETAAAAAGGAWEPKGQRVSREGGAPGSRSSAEPEQGSWSELLTHAVPVAERPVKAGLELAQSAVRAGRSVAGLAVEVGKEAADRVDRALSGDKRDRS
jgi:uncharacterized membrane protein